MILLCILACIVIIAFSFLTTAEKQNEVFKISGEYYTDNCDFLEYNSKVFIANYDNNAYISVLDTDTGSITKLSDIQTDNMVGADIQDNILALACKSGKSDDANVLVFLYDIDNNFESLGSVDLLISDACINCMKITNNGSETAILSKDKSCVYFFDLIDFGEPVCYTFSEPVSNIIKTENSLLYAQNTQNSTVFSLKKAGIEKYQDSTIDFPVSFIDDNTVISNSGKVYGLNSDSKSFKFIFDTANNNGIAYKQGDDVFSLCKDCLLVLDSKTHKEQGQIDLQYIPDKIKYCGENILCFSKGKDELIIEKAPNVLQQTKYINYDKESNVFITEPEKDIYQNIEPTVNAFKIIFDSDNIRGGLRGDITVDIAFGGETQTMTTKDGIEFITPDELRFNIENLYDVGTYNVCVSGLCDNDGKPVKLKYSFSVVEKGTSSQNSSSEPTSSISSSSQETSSKEVSTDIKSDKYHIDYSSKYILGVESGTTVAKLKSNLICEDELEICNNSGKTVKSGNVGTGFSVKSKNGVDEYLLVIYGDVTGEGNINSRDLNAVINCGLGTTEFEDCFDKASDFNRNGIFDDMDIALLGEYVNKQL